jgi:hypothetical protein
MTEKEEFDKLIRMITRGGDLTNKQEEFATKIHQKHVLDIVNYMRENYEEKYGYFEFKKLVGAVRRELAKHEY